MPTYPACLATAVIALCAACSSLPKTFPRFEDAEALPALVVGTIEHDRYLDAFPECEQPDVICMDPPPLLLTVKISRTVHGPHLIGRTQVATTSHYGRGTHAPGSGDILLLLLKVHGQELVLPRYAIVSVEPTASGDLAIPDWGTFPVWWLPCSAMALREPIEFTRSAERDAGRIDTADLAGLVSVSGGKALPLFGLRLSRLAEHLSSLSPSVTEMACHEPRDD